MSTRYVTMLAAAAALGGFLFGYDTSTMNSAIVGMRQTLDLGAGTVGFVVAIALIGCAAGAWFSGPIAARHGRNRVMLIAGLLVTAGSLGAVFANQILLLALSRLLTGLGIGGASAVVPGYIAEIAPTRIRGRLGSFWQFAIVIGQLLGLIVGFLLADWAGSEAASLPWGGAAWRGMFASVAVAAALYLLVVRTLPRTPHDLIRFGDEPGARALLARLGADVDAEIASIAEGLSGGRRVPHLRDLRGSRLGLIGIVWVGILLAAFQQLVGINAVKTYSNTVWQSVGFTIDSAFTLSIVTVLVSIGSTIVAIIIMDRVGRRTMLAAGAAAMTIALVALAAFFSTATGSGTELSIGRNAGIGALIAINTFAVAFGVTWGPVMWLMLSELFDTNLRTTAVAVCTTVNWLTNWAVTRTFPLLAGASLGLTYGIYAVFAAMAFIFALKVLPETRGRELA